MLLKLWSGALQTNRRTWTSQYLLSFLIYTHRYNSICSKFPPNAVNVNVFWSFPLLLPLLLLGCWRLVFPPMAADCNISPLAMFWNIIYSVFTVQFRIFEVPPTLTHTAPSPRHQVIICHNKPTWHVRIYLVKVVSCPTFWNLTWIPLINVHKLFTKWHALLFIQRPTHPAEKWRDIRVRESKRAFTAALLSWRSNATVVGK